MTFSEKLIRLRKREGLSQEELAQYLVVSRQAVSRWEQGTAMPDAGNLLKLKQRFHVTADWLLEDAQGWEALTGSEENTGTGARSAAETAVCTPAPQIQKSILPWAIPLGLSCAGLLILGIFSSVFPCEYSIGAVASPFGQVTPEKTYTGVAGFLACHNLEWLFLLCLAVFGGSLAAGLWQTGWQKSCGNRKKYRKTSRQQNRM